MQSSVQLEGNCIGSGTSSCSYMGQPGMWTHSGYQLSQIARVKPTHSLTSVSTASSPRTPLSTKPPSSSYPVVVPFPPPVVPLSRTPSPWSGQVPSPDWIRRRSLLPPPPHLSAPPTTEPPCRFFVAGEPASFPGCFLLTSDCFCPWPAAPWPNRFAVLLNFPDRPCPS